MAEAQVTETQGTSGAAGTPPITQTPPPAAGAGAGGTQQQKPKEEQTPPKTEPKRHRLEVDGDIPDDAELLELSKTALKGRLSRHTTAELKKRFGTDDVDSIKKDLDELKTLREEKEENRKKALSELEREKEERVKETARADAAEAKAREASSLRVYDKENRRVEKIAAKYIDEDYTDRELYKFADYLLKTYSEKELGKLRGAGFEAEAEKFFKGRVEKKPKLAKDYETTREAAIRQELKDEAAGKKPKVKVTNGGDTSGRGTPPKTEETSEPKTFAPGKKNSMSDKEAREGLKALNGGRMPY